METVVVQLNHEAATELVRREATGSGRTLPGLEQLGRSLEPMHPGESDPALASYFTVEVPDAAAADRAIAVLREHEAVEAAYVKPSEEPP
ncbi:MAG TPA: hypothetical protein VGI73_02160 [Solirubrobacterales bacterium]|jgi:hypothetical protein